MEISEVLNSEVIMIISESRSPVIVIFLKWQIKDCIQEHYVPLKSTQRKKGR